MRTSSPLESTFEALREIARETAHRLGKEVRLQLVGTLDAGDGPETLRLREALVHALRNAIDHGVESAEERVKSGKLPAGQISVVFAEENDEIVIRVRDDGAGVDFRDVARRAAALGLVDSGRALAKDEALALLFEPGFSTREIVTEISGRGVGLDIVRANVESLAGSVEIDATRGEGTTLTLRIPRKHRAEAA